MLGYLSSAIPSAAPTSAASLTTTITAAELAAHSTASSCWQEIHGLVLDVTPFPTIHSGGSQSILSYCGQSATTAFDNTARHPSSYITMMVDRHVLPLCLIFLFGRAKGPLPLDRAGGVHSATHGRSNRRRVYVPPPLP